MSDNTVEIIIKASTAQAAAAIKALSSDVNSQLRQASTASSGAWASAGRSITSSIQGAGSAVRGLIGHVFSLKTALVGIAAGYAAVKLAKSFIDTAASFDKMKISLETVTKGEGAKWFKDLNEWAMKMPVNTETAIQSFILMRAMGLSPTIDQMTTLVDTMGALGGNEETLSGIARALGQITSKGAVSAEELMQLAERGVPAMEILRNKFGDVETSTLNAGDAVQALLDGMKELYGGQSEKIQSKWSGLMESLNGYWTEFKRLVMESGVMEWLETKVGGIMSKLDEMYNSGALQQWADIIGTQVVAGLEAVWTWAEDIYVYITENWPEIKRQFSTWWDILKGAWKTLGFINEVLIGVWNVADWIVTAFEDAWGFVDRLIGRIEYFGLGKVIEMIMEPKIKMSPPQPWKSGIEEMQADLEATGEMAVGAFDFSSVADGLADIRTSVSDAVMQISSMPTTISQAMGGYGAPIPEVSQILSGLRDQEVFGGSLAGWLSLGARFDSPGGSLGSYAKGTDYVPRTGLYMLHQGEAVITSGENSKSGKSGVPNVNISGISINVSGANVENPETLAAKLADAFDREIAKMIRYGRSNIAAALAG